MKRLLFSILFWLPLIALASPYCPTTMAPKRGYLTVGYGRNISSHISSRYFSRSVAELANIVATVTEAERPGYRLVLNSPTDGSRSPICFMLYIKGKLYGDNPAASACGAYFNPGEGLPICPQGYVLKKGPQKNECISQNPDSNLCPEFEKTVGEQDCCVGNPIYPVSGNKFAIETDYQSPEPYSLQWSRTYNSARLSFTRLGQQWRHTFDRVLVHNLPHRDESPGVTIFRPDGKNYLFTKSGNSWVSENAALGTLLELPGGEFQFFDRESQTTELYDAAGRLKTLTFLGGFKQTLTYSDEGLLKNIQDDFGRTLTINYGKNRLIQSVQAPGGSTSQYEYDKGNRLTAVIHTDGTRRTYHYENSNAPHALTGITNENGVRFASWQYDNQGRANVSTHALGVETTKIAFQDKEGARLVENALGENCRYQYVTLAGEAKISEFGGAGCSLCPAGARWTYDSNGFLTQFVDCKGLSTTYERDGWGREIKRIEGTGASQTETTTLWHPVWNLPLQITEPLRTLSFEYNESGLLIRKSEQTGGQTRIWRYRHNPQGLLTELDGPRDELSDVMHFSYDAQGHLLSVQNEVGHTTRFTAYDAEGRVKSLVDGNGLEKKFSFDARGRLTAFSEDNKTTELKYDAGGQLLEMIHPDQTKTQNRYDETGRLIESVAPTGTKTVYAYNPLNQPIAKQVYDRTGTLVFQEQGAFNSRGLPLTHTDGLGHSSTWTYGPTGQLAAYKNPNGASTSYVYDPWGHLITLQDPLGGQTQLTYNLQHQLLSLTDPTSLTTRWSVNGFNQIQGEENPNRGTTTYTYDKAGNPVSLTNALGQSIQTTYDALNRPTQITAPGESIRLVYDEGAKGKGRLSAAHYAQGNIAYEYNPFGQLLSQTDTVCLSQPCSSFKQQYQYDAMGRVQTIQYPSGHIQRFTYNPQGEGTAITLQTEQGAFPIATSISSSPLNRWKNLTLGNGIALERRFNLDGNLVNEQTGSQKTEYTYDANANLLSLLDDTGQHDFGYDLLSRLISDKGTAITYDNVGNRLTRGEATYQYKNNINQLMNVQLKTTFSYNSAGQLTQKNSFQFEHDAFGRLKTIREGDTPKTEYVYNAFHLRIAKVFPGAAQKFYFVYNPNGQLLAEYNERLELVREYFYFQNEPIAVFTQNKLYYLQGDALGTPKIATDQNQQVVWRVANTAFGEGAPTIHTLELPLRFPGQYYDAESGLHYNWHRYYDSFVGRYIEPDPIGLAGGVNLYVYANNNPLRWVDPMGLFYPVDFIGGLSDLMGGRNDMIDAATSGADVYFHCRANCEASRRGLGGYHAAVTGSAFREFIQNEAPLDRARDEAANTQGQCAGKDDPKADCYKACANLIPHWGVPRRHLPPNADPLHIYQPGR